MGFFMPTHIAIPIDIDDSYVYSYIYRHPYMPKHPPSGRKPGGASDGEEPEPDGIEAEQPP